MSYLKRLNKEFKKKSKLRSYTHCDIVWLDKDSKKKYSKSKQVKKPNKKKKKSIRVPLEIILMNKSFSNTIR